MNIQVVPRDPHWFAKAFPIFKVFYDEMKHPGELVLYDYESSDDGGEEELTKRDEQKLMAVAPHCLL